MRLNRYLAAAGLGSRRSVEELIRAGRVRINDRVVVELATRVEPGDRVKIGTRLLQTQQTLSAVLYKPRGYLCTASDERNRRTIFELLPETWPRVFHVGRLDKESEGLLIITNDGELSLAVTHPRYKIEKEYEVGIDQPLDPAHREKLLRGFRIPGGHARAERVDLLAPRLLRIVLKQGIKRQVRLMLYELGYEVANLRRTRIGTLKLGRLKPAEWRLLSPREIAQLKTGDERRGSNDQRPRPKNQGSPNEQ